MPLESNLIAYTSTVDGTTVERLEAVGQGTALDPYRPVRAVVGFPINYTETQLTAPGTTTARDARGYQYLSFYVTVAGISTSVSFTPEISPNNTIWAAMQSSFTLTENGTVYVTFDYKNTLGYVRLNWFDEQGGSSATVDVITVVQ